MISQFRLRIMGIIVGITVAMSVPLVACGAPSLTPSTPLRLSSSATPTPAPPKADDTSLRLKAEGLYQRTAGGAGCQACHGADAKGGNLGPNIRGKSAEDIQRALTSDQMSFINLTNEEIEALAAYLKYLASQP